MRNQASHWTFASIEENSTAERIQPFQLAALVNGGSPLLLQPIGEFTGDHGGDQERRKRYPILWIGDRQCSHRRKEEEIEAESREKRGEDCLLKSPLGRNHKYKQQENQTGCCGVHARLPAGSRECRDSTDAAERSKQNWPKSLGR
jgi:hypothetical protein